MQAQTVADLLPNELASLQRFALSLTRHVERAEDLVQDTIERAILKAHLFDGANLRSWLFTICRRIFLNNIRQTKTRGVSVTIEDAPDSAICVPQDQEIKVHFSHVVDQFHKLSMSDKVILSLVVVDGLKYEEVAAALDIPVGTVRSRLSRARSRLLQMIEGGSQRSDAAETEAFMIPAASVQRALAA